MGSVSQGWLEHFNIEEESFNAWLEECLNHACANVENEEEEIAELCKSYDSLNCEYDQSLDELLQLGVPQPPFPEPELTGPLEPPTPTSSIPSDSKDNVSTAATSGSEDDRLSTIAIGGSEDSYMVDRVMEVLDNRKLSKLETMAKVLDVVGNDYTPRLPQLTRERFHSGVGPIRGQVERRHFNRKKHVVDWFNHRHFKNGLKTGYVYL
jgi:hypothetical protein